jgi:hypothetical protein
VLIHDRKQELGSARITEGVQIIRIPIIIIIIIDHTACNLSVMAESEGNKYRTFQLESKITEQKSTVKGNLNSIK